MLTRCWSCMLGLLILLTCSNVLFSEDWGISYQSGVDPAADLTANWTATGDWSSQGDAITIKSDQEALLRLNAPISDPVIQVQFDFTVKSETFNEAGVIIGLGGGGRRAAAQFILSGGEQPNVRLVVPARTPVIVDNLTFKTGESYSVLANVNGMSVELFINGTQVAQRQLLTPLNAGQIALFATEGEMVFENLRIRTKKISDAQAAQRAREITRDLAFKAQFEDGYVPPIWDPSKMTFRQRSARVRIKQIPLQIQSDYATSGMYPVTVGVPIEDRQMFRPRQFRLLDANGQQIPSQFTPIAQWDQEDAIKWVLLDTQVQITDPANPPKLTLEYGRSVPNEEPPAAMPIQTTDGTLTVDTGKLKVTFNRKSGTLIDSATIDGKTVMAPDPKRGGFFVDNQDVTYRTSGNDEQYALVTEVNGPMHTILRATGWYVSDAGQKACRYVTRIHLYKDQTMIRMEHTWIVTVDTDQFWFKDLGLNLPMTLGQSTQAVIGNSDEKLTDSVQYPIAGKPVTVTQNDLAASTVTQNGKTLSKSQRCGGWVSLLGSDMAATVTVTDMAMQFPNSLKVTDQSIVFHAWQTLDDKQLNFRHDGITKLWGQETWDRFNSNVTSQGALESRVSNGLGFARTHHLTLTFHEPKVSAAQTAGALGQVQPIASLDPKWVKESEVLPVVLPVFDPQRFGQLEDQIKARYDEYIQVATHLDPMVGFWDYGRGCPPDLTPGSNDRWQYSGINASEDMSRGNPQVPWLLYLRSGDRKYLRRAQAMTTHVMDTRIMHWYAKSLGREIGQSYKHTGTWVFDGSDAGWTGDIWAGFLATAYHLTGNQRSLDVLGEIAQGYIHTKRTIHNHQTISYLGAVARYYLTSFDPKLRDTLVQTTPIYMQYQNETGFWPSNDQAYEYALLEMLKLPRAESSWENTAMIFARGAIGPMRFHTQWAMAAGVQAWAYEHKQSDARFGVNAREALENGIPKLIGPSNLTPLKRSLIWMGLTDIPGIDDVVQPKVISYARPQESVFYLKHVSGQQTHIELHCKQAEVSILDLDGNPISPNLLRSQRAIGIYEITLPQSMEDAQYKIDVKPPKFFETPNGAMGRTLPWRPGENEMLVVLHGPTLFVQDISNGKLTHSPGKQLWFNVPRRTAKFSIQTADPWPLINDMIVQRPNGSIIKNEGSFVEIEPESSQTGELWMVQAKQPYFQLTESTFARGTIAPGYCKLTGIPPFVAFTKDSYFNPIAATSQNDEINPASTALTYPRGKFRRGLRLQGNLSYLKIPTGNAISDDPTIREYLNTARGTIEMFVRFDRRCIEGGYSGKLLHIPYAQSNNAMMDFVPAASWEGVIRSGGSQPRQLSITNSNCSPSIEAGKWYHLAIQWDLNDNGKVMRRVYLDGYPYAYGDVSGAQDPIDWWPQAITPAQPGEWIYIGDKGGKRRVQSAAMVIDELRISNIPRYPFMPGPPKVGGRKAFNPPEETFTPDTYTCSLFHFEGTPEGLDKHGKPVKGQWVSEKPEKPE